jgi:hypothetical protein
MLYLYDFKFFWLQEKRKKKQPKQEGDYTLTKVTPLASSWSSLTRSYGGSESTTRGEFEAAPSLAKWSAHLLPSKSVFNQHIPSSTSYLSNFVDLICKAMIR